MIKNANKKYIGDGVYAEVIDGWLYLTTSDGMTDTNEIVLDNEVLSSLIDFLGIKKVSCLCETYN